MGAKHQLQQAPTNTCCNGEDGVCSLHSILQAAGSTALQELARLLAQVLATDASLQLCSSASALLVWGRCRYKNLGERGLQPGAGAQLWTTLQGAASHRHPGLTTALKSTAIAIRICNIKAAIADAMWIGGHRRRCW